MLYLFFFLEVGNVIADFLKKKAFKFFFDNVSAHCLLLKKKKKKTGNQFLFKKQGKRKNICMHILS